MIAMAAYRLGYRCSVFCESENDPAAQVCDSVVAAPYDDFAALERFVAGIDVVTFEFENTGRINPLFEVRTIKGDMYATGDGILRLLLEGFVVVIWAIVTYLMIRDAITSARTSKHYFKHFNNLDNIAEAAQQLISDNGQEA